MSLPVAAVPLMSSGSMRSTTASKERKISALRGRSVLSSSIRPVSVQMSRSSSQTTVSSRATAMEPSR